MILFPPAGASPCEGGAENQLPDGTVERRADLRKDPQLIKVRSIVIHARPDHNGGLGLPPLDWFRQHTLGAHGPGTLVLGCLGTDVLAIRKTLGLAVVVQVRYFPCCIRGGGLEPGW